MKYTQDLEVGMIYYLSDYTAPKVFNGLFFECLVTDQKIAAHSKVSTKTGQHIKEWDFNSIYMPERFGLINPQIQHISCDKNLSVESVAMLNKMVDSVNSSVS